MEKQTKKYNKTLVNKKRETLRRLCYNEDNNEILVQGADKSNYSINIDETTDEVIMNIELIGKF
tara:strand:+ start:192 stop:383 length:192 start_codon:yes stop_codon:yes gene_type:complete